MKTWKIIRLVTLIMLIFFLVFVGFLLMESFLRGNFSSDFWGVTVYYWYERFAMTLAVYLYILSIPLVFTLLFFIISSVKIKRHNRDKKS